MNLASIVFPVFNPYQKATVELYLAGCFRKCLNCHNPEIQNFNVGEEIDIGKLAKYLKERERFFSIISITGGDLLCQNEKNALAFINNLIIFGPEKKLWLFTGAEWGEIPNWCKEKFDVIKTGKYIEELKQEGFPASSNQKINIKGKDY